MAKSLRRVMGLRTVTSTSAGLAFAAIEYLAVAGLVIYVAGSTGWIAIAVAGLLAVLVWGFYGELNGMYPTAAAIRLYMSKAMDDRAALSITFTYMTTIVLVIAADAVIVGSAIGYLLGQSGWAVGVIIFAILLGTVLSNLFGLRLAGGVQDIATYSVLAATVAITAYGLAHHGVNLPNLIVPLAHKSPFDFVQAVAYGVFLYAAFEWVTASAEEVLDIGLIPKGMFLAILALFATCSLIAIDMPLYLNKAQLYSAIPQLYLGANIAGYVGLVLMVVVTAVTAINTFNGGFITASRFMYAAAREGNLPRMFSRLNTRAVPYVPVIGLATASFIIAILVVLTNSWQTIVALGAALEGMIYSVAGLCVVRLRKKLPEQKRPFRLIGAKVLGWLGVIIFAFLALAAATSVKGKTDFVPLALLLGLGILSTLYVLLLLPKIKARQQARYEQKERRRPVRKEG